jgi:hypothetical protein
MSRKIVIAVALLGAVGVLVLGLASGANPRESKVEAEQRLGPEFGGQRRTMRSQRPPVDPASPTYEGREARENRAWDELRSSDRVDRAERVVAAALIDVDARVYAWMVLSAARPDFFSTEAGARRYLELEQALVNAQSPSTR